MLPKALAARPQVGLSLSNPLRRIVSQPRIEPPAAGGSAVSAGLTLEDDFELGGEFLDVFTRASERVAGFVVGCSVIGIVWLLVSML